MEDIPKKSRLTQQVESEEEELSAKDIRDKILALQSQLSRENLLKNYRKKLVEAMEKGELDGEDDELVNSEDLMKEDGEGEEEEYEDEPEEIQQELKGDATQNSAQSYSLIPSQQNQAETKQISFQDIMTNVQSSLVGLDVKNLSQEDIVNQLISKMMGQDETSATTSNQQLNEHGSQANAQQEEAEEFGFQEEEEEEDFDEEAEEENNEDDLNSEERAELEELQNQGFNPMQTLGRLIAGLDGTPVPEEGQKVQILNNSRETISPPRISKDPHERSLPELEVYCISDVINDYSEQSIDKKNLQELDEMLGDSSIEKRLQAIYALLKKSELLDQNIDQRRKILDLKNFDVLTTIFDFRDDFRPYIIKTLYFLIGSGENRDLRERVFHLFNERITLCFGSFDTTQSAFSLELAIKIITLPGAPMQINPDLGIPNEQIVQLVRKISSVDSNQCTEPLKALAMKYRSFNQGLQLLTEKQYPLFAQSWLEQTLEVLGVGKVFEFRCKPYQEWLSANPFVLSTLLSSDSLRTKILAQTKKIPGSIFFLMSLWQNSEDAGRGAQLFDSVPGLREEVAFRDILAIPDSSM